MCRYITETTNLTLFCHPKSGGSFPSPQLIKEGAPDFLGGHDFIYMELYNRTI